MTPDPMRLSFELLGDRAVVLTRELAAAPARVFSAFTTPEALMQWMTTPRDWPLTRCEIALEVGGSFRYEWTRPDGQTMGLTGEYLVVEAPHRLEHTEVFDEDWTGGPTHIVTEFQAAGRGTRVVMTIHYQSPAGREAALSTGMVRGMELTYLLLDDLLADRLGLYEVDPELDLVLERIVPVPPSAVWRAWTDPQLLVQWFTPPPWRTTHARVGAYPGGPFETVMEGPNGERNAGSGCVLVAEENRLLVWTDAVGEGYRPSGEAFMTGILKLTPHPEGTQYTTIVRHADPQARSQHQAMGFERGWGTALDQLVALMSV